MRISASLDLPTLLGEIVDSARALTGARYGAVTTVDADGQLQDFVTRGTTEAEHRRLLEWPDGPRLFERLRDLPGPSASRTCPRTSARSASMATS